MRIQKFKNGNINVQFEKDYDYSDNLIELLCNSCELDFIFMKEGYLGNFGYSFDVYNVNNQKMYSIYGEELEKFKNNQTIKLIACSFYKNDYEDCENFCYL